MPYKDKEKQRIAQAESARRRTLRNKKIVIDMYGGRCQECGYNNPIALELDHIKPIKRKFWGTESGSGLWSRVARGLLPKQDFNLLCANCHSIKTYSDNSIRE